MNSDKQDVVPVIPFRIRIGVTGHRDLTETEDLSKRVVSACRKGVFELFDRRSRQILQSSPQLPVAFSIVTPLAEGADRLVTKALLGEKNFGDTRIEAILPLRKEDYVRDFRSEASRQEFEALLGMARRPITLKGPSHRGDLFATDSGSDRRQAYEDVGRYVVDHCDVLIALWNGKPSGGKGGTAEIVEYARKRRRPMIVISTESPYGIALERGNMPDAGALRQIEALNAGPAEQTGRRAYIDHVFRDLFDNPEGRFVPDATKQLVRDNLLPLYVSASTIAKRNQAWYRYAGLIVYAFSAAAVALVALGTLFQRFSHIAFFLEFLLLLTILVTVWLADRRRSHRKWIENRFLAERLRSAVFLAVCGVEASPIDVPPYLRTAHGSHDWMVRAFDEAWGRLPKMSGCREEYCGECAAFVRKRWIEDQVDFHRRRSADLGTMSRLLERSGMMIFLVAMAAAVTHLILSLSGHGAHSERLEQVLTFIAIALPAAGAAIGGIRAHREYSRVEKRSQNMEIILTDLWERFSDVRSGQRLESLLRETEEIILRETQDWLMLMRFAELKPAA